jgi:DNA sulfur modification protein DndB
MKFPELSGEGGAKIILNPKESSNLKSQIDIVAIDNEVALAVECKSSAEYRKRPQFQEELGKFCQLKESFSKTIRNNYSQNGIRKLSDSSSV